MNENLVFFKRINLSPEDLAKAIPVQSALKSKGALLSRFNQWGFQGLASNFYEGNSRGWLESSIDAANLLMGRGAPKGRIIEIFGPEASCKTSFSLLFAAAAQREGGLAAMYDVEQAASPDRFTHFGVNINELMYIQSKPDSILTVEKIYDSLIKSMIEVRSEVPDFPLVFIWDSIAATTTEKELEGETGDAVMAEHARLHSQGLRKLNQFIAATNSLLILINQTRDKIGSFPGGAVPQSTFGGRAIKFYASVRIQVKKVFGKDMIENGKNVGETFSFHTIKNKVAPPKRTVEIPVYYDERGFDNESSIFSALKSSDLITLHGSWYHANLKSGLLKFQSKDWESVWDEKQSEFRELMRTAI